jgi:hypothetical protein
MLRQRLTTTFALLALGSCCAFVPAASASSTLLSGYGGPGEGNQAILGATVIGGAGGSKGGGGSNGGGSAGTGSAAPQTVSIEASQAPVQTPKASGATGSGGRSGAAKPQAHPRRQKATGATTAAGATAPAKAVVAGAVSAPALGLSGSDIAYVVLAFLVLTLTAFVTVLLTRGERGAQGGRGEIDSR